MKLSIIVHARSSLRPSNLIVALALISALGILNACGGSGGDQNPPPATLTISTTSLPNGQTGIPYSATLTATGGTPALTWSMTSGALPTGLMLNASAGTITGTPTQSVTSASLTFEVLDSGMPQQTKSVTLTLTIASGTVSLSVSPVRAGLTVTQPLPISATVVNDSLNKGVSWTASAGSFSSMTSASGVNVTYTAPPTAGVYTITATSVTDVTQSATATIGVTDLPGVFTYHNDIARDGSNTAEFALTTANVNTNTFGKLFSCTADGAIYAQPLWVANVNIGVGKHNVIVAATMHDSVYVFDADANPCVTYWHKQLIPAGETYFPASYVVTKDIYPDIGILGTPVIDSATNTVYLVTKTGTTGGASFIVHQRLHALSLIDGSERPNSPVEINNTITVPGNCEGGSTVAFNTVSENQRPGLALVNGVVYVSWASHGDHDPYHGWIIGYSTSNLRQVAVFNSSPNAAEGFGYCRGGIWMAGGAPAADSANNLYVITGNGIWDGASAYGDTILKLGTTSGLSVADWFTPMNQLSLDGSDSDLGAGGAAILVDQPSGPHPHLIIGGGKSGSFYLLDRTNMGHFTAGGPDNVVQILTGVGGSFSTPAFWQNTLYFFGWSTHGKAFSFLPASDTFNPSVASSTTATFSFPGSTPSVSASGSSNGIVWTIDSSAFGTNNSSAKDAGPAILHAFDATNLDNELWNSTQVAADAAGNAVKFTVPTVANGKVYVPTRGNDSTQGAGTIFGEIDVYGLKPN
ncbi:MAG: putative Ig domain-containing protein [Candidatus Acidiferrales bacterium]